eukprot:5790160-Heterocapsa_arctica.AAC.1
MDCTQSSLGLGHLTHAVHLLLDVLLDDVTVVVVPISSRAEVVEEARADARRVDPFSPLSCALGMMRAAIHLVLAA